MNFGQAIEALKAGKKVARFGWNDKGMFLKYIGAGDYSVLVSIVEGKILPLEPWIGMKTAVDAFIPWLSSQADTLAEDWVIVE